MAGEIGLWRCKREGESPISGTIFLNPIKKRGGVTIKIKISRIKERGLVVF